MKHVYILLLFFIFSLSTQAASLGTYLSNQKAATYYADQDYENALNETLSLQNNFPEEGGYYHNLGQISLDMGSYDDAATYYNEAIKRLPKEQQTPSLFGLGSTYLFQQNPEPAIDIFKQLLKEDPSNEGAKQNLELALSLLKQQQQQQEQQQENQDENTQENQDSESSNDDASQNSQDQQNDDQDADSQNSPSSLEQEKQDALNADKQKQEEQKQHAHDILDTLSQREEEARKKYLKKQMPNMDVDYDW